MLAGELYEAQDAQLTQERIRTRLLIKELNDSHEDQPEERMFLPRAIPVG